MPYRLFRFALRRKYSEPRMFREPEVLKRSYEVVIIGGGGHGLAAAYYLARDHGISDVAVLERSYIGSGGTGRNTAIVRSNYLTPEGRFSTKRASSSSRISPQNSISISFTLNVGTLRWPIPIRRCARCVGERR